MAKMQQRQDSVYDQLRDLIKLANQNGMYDAADWVRHRWNQGRHRDEVRL